ncbi:serine protease gd-like isoform X1 [Periplaneta americana]|uniref:serine protease gd-like isoform X1 n=1 Tax=Periplaneta americana TaxID=6978 RepID=UPI0037E86B4F
MLRVRLLGFLVVLARARGQSVPVSPCPQVFQYQVESSGTWYGLINVPTPQPSHTVRLSVELAINAVLPTQYIGKLQLVEDKAYVWSRILSGDKRPVQYRLLFPLPWPLPIVRLIASNQNVICSSYNANNAWTIVNLEHILYPILDNTSPQGTNFFNYQLASNNGKNNVQYFEFEPHGSSLHNYGYGDSVSKEPSIAPWSSHSNTQGLIKQPSVSSPPATPCPDVFYYQHDGNGNWFGVISVPNPYPIIAIDLRVDIYVTGRQSLLTKGDIQLANNLQDVWNWMRHGNGFFVLYKLRFPMPSALPTIKSVIVNSEVICRGNKPSISPWQIISYQYSIHSDRCQTASLECPYNIEQRRYPENHHSSTTPPSFPLFQPYSPTTEPVPQTSPPILPKPEPEPKPPITSEPEAQIIPRTEPPTIYETASARKPEKGDGTTIHCGETVTKTRPLISYGQDTVRGEWPWHVALYWHVLYDFKYMCGGSFVGTRTVITAAHCVTKHGKPLNASDIIAYLGRYDLRYQKEEDSQDKNVAHVLVHPTYNYTSLKDDIAMLILSGSVEVTLNVRPVCLWDQEDTDLASIVDKEGLVVGWGLNEKGQFSERLKTVKMPVVNRLTCIMSDPDFFAHFTSNTSYCAGFRNESSPCNGDSGGGMVFPKQQAVGGQIWMLRGVVSTSRPRNDDNTKCDTTNYILFTDVAQYLNWISLLIV